MSTVRELSDPIDIYYKKILELYNLVLEKERTKIEAAAEVITERITKDDGLLYVLGSGHSMLIAQEMFARAGGLMQVNAILDPALSTIFQAKALKVERLEGYAKIVLEYYGLTKNDVLLVVSVSGINAVPVEAAIEAKKLGAYVIALTSVEWSKNVPQEMVNKRNIFGKRLFEVADLYIDNHVPFGDAVVKIDNYTKPVAPVSTLVNSFIVNLIVAKVAQNCASKGIPPPVWASSNVPGGDKMDAPFVEKYRFSRVKHF
jgi:uncharacterized phosphosugar-binding protein